MSEDKGMFDKMYMDSKLDSENEFDKKFFVFLLTVEIVLLACIGYRVELFETIRLLMLFPVWICIFAVLVRHCRKYNKVILTSENYRSLTAYVFAVIIFKAVVLFITAKILSVAGIFTEDSGAIVCHVAGTVSVAVSALVKLRLFKEKGAVYNRYLFITVTATAAIFSHNLVIAVIGIVIAILFWT